MTPSVAVLGDTNPRGAPLTLWSSCRVLPGV